MILMKSALLPWSSMNNLGKLQDHSDPGFPLVEGSLTNVYTFHNTGSYTLLGQEVQGTSMIDWPPED